MSKESQQRKQNRDSSAATDGWDSHDERPDGVPSNAELSEAVARLEENVDHVAETVDRIDDNVSEQQEAMAAQLEENTTRTRHLWSRYQVGKVVVKWGVPTAAALVSGIAATGIL